MATRKTTKPQPQQAQSPQASKTPQGQDVGMTQQQEAPQGRTGGQVQPKGRANSPEQVIAQAGAGRKPAPGHPDDPAAADGQTVQVFANGLHAMRQQLEQVLPPGLAFERFMRTAVNAVQLDQSLLKADRRTLYQSIQKAATDGLILDGRDAALVQFRNNKTGNMEVQYMPMIAGIVKQLGNCGIICSSEVVYSNDQFDIQLGTDRRIVHSPCFTGDRGEPILVYAIAQLPGGAIDMEWITKDEVMKVRGIAKTKNVWDGAFAGEMWRKTVVRRLSKRLPMSAKAEQVMASDNALYDLPTGPKDVTPDPAKLTSAAAAILAAPE